MVELVGTLTTNFNYSLDLDVLDQLRANPALIGSFEAQDFWGEVSCSAEGIWTCEVWVHHQLVEMFRCGDLGILLHNVRSRYGKD